MASVLDLVKHYQHTIEKYPNDEQRILKCIDKLFNLGVTVQHLQDTGVGRTVNALRKEPGEVGQAARALVYKWKMMVAAEESDQDNERNNDTSTYNGHDDKKFIENTSNHSRSRHDSYEKKQSSNHKEQSQEINGSYSGNKRKYHSSEDEEPNVKKSKHYSSSDSEHKSKSEVKIKKEKSESDSEDNDSNESQSDDSDSEMSESSQEEVKVKQELKKNHSKDHKSSSSKHSSHSNHKDENTSTKSKSHDSSDKHKHHSSKSKERHSSEKSSSKERSSSHKHKSSTKDKEEVPEKKFKSHKSSESEKSKKETKSSTSKESGSDKHKSSHKSDSSEKHKSYSEKHSNKSDKHKGSTNSSNEKEKHKISSEKENSSGKHKSEKNSTSSKDKYSSSSKDKSKDRSDSKDKSNSHSEKQSSSNSKSSSSNDKSKHDRSGDKSDDKSSDKKSKQRSSSSSEHKNSKSSSSKSKDDTPKKKVQIHSNTEDSDDGIDCGSGASFAEALGMISPVKPKKKSLKDTQSPNSFSNDLSPAALLAPNAKLAPLPALDISALPEISPNYKPRPPPKLLPHFTDEDAMNHVISSKNQRTKVYSGNKVVGKITSLYEMCVHVLQEHIDALEYTGGVPYEILKPVVDRATPQQLFVLEHYNPYLMEDTDHLWQKFCEKNFRNKKRLEMETWREMYMRCQEEQEHKLKSLTANIKMTQEAKKAPIKQTKMAYVDSVVKPPRNIAKKQAVHGTAHVATASPAARVASLSKAANVIRSGSVRPPPAAPVSASTFNKPKKAPLMQKALQFMRGRKR